MEVKIKKISKDAVTPNKATKGSAAYDVYTPKDYIVKPGRQVLPLGIAIQLPYGYEAKIEPRSGFSSKGMEGHKIDVLEIDGHTTQISSDIVRRFDADVISGKIDSDFCGEIGAIVISREDRPFLIPKHTRIAQLTIYKVEDAEFTEVEQLDETERGEGGFGHTGTR